MYRRHIEPYVLVVSPAQLGEVGQLLDPDDGVIEGRLQRLGHGVGQDHRYHHRQDVRDLASQLEHDDCGGNCVRDCSRQGRRTCRRGINQKKSPKHLSDEIMKGRLLWRDNSPDRWIQGGKQRGSLGFRSIIHQNDESYKLQ